MSYTSTTNKNEREAWLDATYLVIEAGHMPRIKEVVLKGDIVSFEKELIGYEKSKDFYKELGGNGSFLEKCDREVSKLNKKMEDYFPEQENE